MFPDGLAFQVSHSLLALHRCNSVDDFILNYALHRRNSADDFILNYALHRCNSADDFIINYVDVLTRRAAA